MTTHNAYKLTDPNMQTHGRFQWTLGVPAETNGEGDLCGPGWLHYYDDPHVAVFMNPAHADFTEFRMFEALAEGAIKSDHDLKHGCTRLTLIREIDPPVITREQRVVIGIHRAKLVCVDPGWNRWAANWLSGKDRSVDAARAAWEAWAVARAAEEEAAAATKAGLPLPLLRDTIRQVMGEVK